MYYIDPITTLAAQLLAGTTLAEDTTTAWASGTFADGDYCHVVATHRVYRCALAGSSTVSPELDPTRWVDTRPTNLWAPFDIYTSTAATATVDITYVLACRFVNAIMLRGMVGKDVTISIKDAPGGSTIYPATTYPLQQASTGYWDYAFGTRRAKPSLILTGLPVRSNAEMTITISADSTNARAVGLIARGKLRALHGTGSFGGTQQDAEAIPKTYSYRRVNADGTQTLLQRGSSKDLSCTVVMELSQADQAVQELEGLLSRPVGWLASLQNGYAGLSAFGIATKSTVTYKTGLALCPIYIEGIV
jgi:hypothetical protein